MNNRICRLSYAALLLAVFLPLNVSAHTDDVADQDEGVEYSGAEKMVVNVLESYAAAYAAADLVAIRNLTVANGSFSYFEGTSVDSSWAEYETHAAAEMPAFSDAHYVFTSIRPHVVGQMAYATFSWAMDVVIVSEQFEGGKHPVSMRGIGTAVLEKENAGWKLRHLQTAREKSAPAR